MSQQGIPGKDSTSGTVKLVHVGTINVLHSQHESPSSPSSSLSQNPAKLTQDQRLKKHGGAEMKKNKKVRENREMANGERCCALEEDAVDEEPTEEESPEQTERRENARRRKKERMEDLKIQAAKLSGMLAKALDGQETEEKGTIGALAIAELQAWFRDRNGKTLRRVDSAKWAFMLGSLTDTLSTRIGNEVSMFRYLDMVKGQVEKENGGTKLPHVMLEALRGARSQIPDVEIVDSVKHAAKCFAESLLRDRISCIQEKNEATVNLRPFNGQGILKLARAFDFELEESLVIDYTEYLFECFSVRAERDFKRAAKNRELLIVLRELIALSRQNSSLLSPQASEFIVRASVIVGLQELVKPIVTSKESARVFIRACLEVEPQKMRTAFSCMKDNQLDAEFPDLSRQFREESIKSALTREKFSEVLYRLERYRDDYLTQLFLETIIGLKDDHFLADYALERLNRKDAPHLAALIDQEKLQRQVEIREETIYKLPLPLSAISFVNNEETCYKMVELLNNLPSHSVVGLDSEWKPNSRSKQAAKANEMTPSGVTDSSASTQTNKEQNRASILQIATRSQVFILDLIWVSSSSKEIVSDVLGAIQVLFLREDVFKLGFGFFGDLKVLSSSFPGENYWTTMHCLVDFQRLEITRTTTKFTVAPRKKARGGFKDLVKLVLGKNLCKLEQMSNWERRPLQHAQTIYAANDVLALIDLFDEIFGDSPSVVGFSHVGTPKACEVYFPRDFRYLEEVRRLHGRAVDHDQRRLNESMDRIRSHCFSMGFQFEVVDSFRDMQPTTDVSSVCNNTVSHSAKDTAASLGVDFSQALKSMAYMVRTSSSPLIPSTSSHSGNGVHHVIAKRLCFSENWSPLLVLLCGDCFVDSSKLVLEIKLCLGGDQDIEIRKASSQECVDHFGAKPGTIGPFAEEKTFPVLLDQRVEECFGATPTPLFCGHGVDGRLVCFRSVKILQKVLRSFTLSVSKPPNQRSQVVKDTPRVKAISVGSNGESSDREEPRFIVDNMLKQVGKMIRTIGLDCLYHFDIPGLPLPYEAKSGGTQALTVAEHREAKRLQSDQRKEELRHIFNFAKERNWVFLTTDRKVVPMADKLGVITCVLENQMKKEDQFADVCKRFGLELDPGRFLTKCMKCCSALDFIPADFVRQGKIDGTITEKQVPQAVAESTMRFCRCTNPSCERIYWEGPKFDNHVRSWGHHFGQEEDVFRDTIEDKMQKDWEAFQCRE